MNDFIDNEKLLFKEECFVLTGIVFDVYREIGSGFLEAVYHECMAIEFQKRSIQFESQKELPLEYKGIPLKQTYRADFICYGKIIVELKAVKEFAPEHKAQILNYLKITGYKLGLLVNFGSYPKAEVIRIANTHIKN